MSNIHVLIPAAGRGTRSQLAIPKCLYPVDGHPIIHNLISLVSTYDSTPTIIVSPTGEPLVRASLLQASLSAYLLIQPSPRGMGDAVLRYEQSPTFSSGEHLLLLWGDLVGLEHTTIAKLVDHHIQASNDFTFVTKVVNRPYTRVIRSPTGDLLSVKETRELPSFNTLQGERDIGLFIFRKSVVFPLLRADLPGKNSSSTNEHGFLYVIEHLVASKYKVEALPIATDNDLISLNTVADIQYIDSLRNAKKTR